MAIVMLFVAERPGNPPFRIMRPEAGEDFEFSRVPCQGEILSMGEDKGGIHATYRVELVVHAPRGSVSRPKGANPFDAEVYAVRVDLTTAACDRSFHV